MFVRRIFLLTFILILRVLTAIFNAPTLYCFISICLFCPACTIYFLPLVLVHLFVNLSTWSDPEGHNFISSRSETVQLVRSIFAKNPPAAVTCSWAVFVNVFISWWRRILRNTYITVSTDKIQSAKFLEKFVNFTYRELMLKNK